MDSALPDLRLYELVKMRRDQCTMAAERLQDCLGEARCVASRFNESEWQIIAAAYSEVAWDRVPWVCEDAGILARYAGLGCRVTPLRGLRQMCGALAHVMGIYVGQFLRRQAKAGSGSGVEAYRSLLMKIIGLSDEDVVAAHTLLEARRVLPAGIEVDFDPEKLLELLANDDDPVATATCVN